MQRAGAASVPSATTSQWIRYRLKLRRRQLTEDVNVEISGRDLGRMPDEGAADRPGAYQFDPKRSLVAVAIARAAGFRMPVMNRIRHAAIVP
jgi:hypothetical protein